MRYETSAAFRRALEERLRQQSLTSATPLARLRKMVAFERFLARLVTAQPHDWVLKGGLALQFRLGERARTTQDVDLFLRQTLPVTEIHRRLVHAALLDLGDWFLFEVARPVQPSSLRFGVQSRLDGRLFETFHADVGVGDPLTEPVELITPPPLLAFCRNFPAAHPLLSHRSTNRRKSPRLHPSLRGRRKQSRQRPGGHSLAGALGQPGGRKPAPRAASHLRGAQHSPFAAASTRFACFLGAFLPAPG